MHNGYTSDTLYHFVGRKTPGVHEGNYQILCQILKEERVSYSRSDVGSGKISYVCDLSNSLFTQDLIVPTVTCYGEIPFGHLGIHTSKYGLFGLGFDKRNLIQSGARPVVYMPFSRHDDRTGLSINGANLILRIERAFRLFAEVEDSIRKGETTIALPLTNPAVSADQAIVDMFSMFSKDFLAFVKVYDCTLSDDHPENYPMEREWRKYQNLVFTADQVSVVIVAPGFADRIRKDFPLYADKVIEYREV